MQEGSFIRDSLHKQYQVQSKRLDWLWTIALFLAAVLLYTINLGGLPLQDLDEGSLATVARQILRSPDFSIDWLDQKLGAPFDNKQAPLMHLLIALSYFLGGVNEWTTRLPGAILTVFSVTLVYCIGREIFRQRTTAIYSSLIFLTMLPMIRFGRLAMLDGSRVCFFLLMLLCLLRSRRDLRYSLGVGLSFSLVCSSQSIESLLLGIIAFLFLLWDTPRLLSSRYMWVGITLGLVPGFIGYAAQWLNSGNAYIFTTINEYFRPVWQTTENQSTPPWFYLWEIILYTVPWIVFLPHSLQHLWENRNLSWAKLILTWGGFYLLAISLMATKQPWYLLPIYPSLSFAIGAKLTSVDNLPLLSYFPRCWTVGLSILAILFCGAIIYFTWGETSTPDLRLALTALALTVSLAALKIERGDREFLMILFWGTYISLLLLVSSNYWIWGLPQSYPVTPVAKMINRSNPSVTNIYTSFPYRRPSLDFYSDRNIIPASFAELQYYWKFHEQPYFLLDNSAIHDLKLQSVKVVDKASGWNLVTKKTH